MVGVAELPVEKLSVCTSLRGTAGAIAGKVCSLAATSTLGAAGGSGGKALGLTSGRGTWRASLGRGAAGGMYGLDDCRRSRVVVDRNRRGYERYGLVVMPGWNQYFRMQHSHPQQGHDQSGLREHAQQELLPRRPPVG